MKIFRNGLAIGLILQLAVGPVFFFIANLTLQRTITDGFMGVLAVTTVDYFYIALSIFGVGKLLENNKIKKAFGIISSTVLVIFGSIIIKGVTGTSAAVVSGATPTNLFTSFTSVFFLTIFSPMTIVFFTSLFTAKAIEYNYTKRDLLIFGLGTGLATFLFMGISVILFSLVKGAVPILLIQILNLIVGCLLIGYGAVRIIKIFKMRKIDNVLAMKVTKNV